MLSLIGVQTAYAVLAYKTRKKSASFFIESPLVYDRVRDRASSALECVYHLIVARTIARTYPIPLRQFVIGIDGKALKPIVAVVASAIFTREIRASGYSVNRERVADTGTGALRPYLSTPSNRVARFKESIV